MLPGGVLMIPNSVFYGVSRGVNDVEGVLGVCKRVLWVSRSVLRVPVCILRV